jgi:hypothetical protein
MTKILKAHGDQGNFKHGWVGHWNWCTDEPVHTHGFVCDNACSCGCNRSFVGIDSAKSTTQAQVIEVTDRELENIKLRLHNRTMLGWNKNENMAKAALASFDILTDELDNFKVGAILTTYRYREGYFKLAILTAIKKGESHDSTRSTEKNQRRRYWDSLPRS